MQEWDAKGKVLAMNDYASCILQVNNDKTNSVDPNHNVSHKLALCCLQFPSTESSYVLCNPGTSFSHHQQR
jgi:hypothetical protein